MAKLDRLGWAAGTCISSHGVRLGIRVDEPELLEKVADRLPPGWRPARSDRVDHVFSLVRGGSGPRRGVRRMSLLFSGITRRTRTPRLEDVLVALESDLRLAVASSARRRVFLHAGVVGWKGTALVLPGKSCSGKTTLVAELLRAGAEYYSDEFAVLDARGRVHPFAKPLSVRRKGGVDRLPPESFGSRAAARPLPVGMVVFTSWRNGTRLRLRRLSAGRGALELLQHAASARRRPEQTLGVLGRVATQAVLVEGTRGGAAEAARALLARLDREAQSRHEQGGRAR
jgi:hypothetical protein